MRQGVEYLRSTRFLSPVTESASGKAEIESFKMHHFLEADAINLGLAKMAEACPGTTFSKLDALRAWHVREETYSKALAEIVNYQHVFGLCQKSPKK